MLFQNQNISNAHEPQMNQSAAQKARFDTMYNIVKGHMAQVSSGFEGVKNSMGEELRNILM